LTFAHASPQTRSTVIERCNKQKNTKIKQSQAKSERGFDLEPRIKSSNTIAIKQQKSSKVKPSLNEVLTRATPDKDKESDSQDHDRKRSRKQAKDKDKKHDSQDHDHDTISKSRIRNTTVKTTIRNAIP
jgi:hypothetical protein